MNITEFFKHIEAELVGGRYKAVIDGVHKFVGETVDGQAVLNAAGKEVLANLPGAAGAIAAAAPVVAAAAQGFPVVPAIEQAAAPLINDALTNLATDAVDALLSGVKSKAKKATP